MDPQESNRKYRNLITNAIPPCLPYLGIHLTDLTFIDDANPTLYNGLINYAKIKLLSNALSQLQQFQQKGYNLQPIYQVQMLLDDPQPRYSEHEIYKISQEREPRKATRNQIL
eukprot:TRINITY_DN12934_c0_g1_i1.p1 TRINITY_DN12934_c0_g1~~TRINITY_DN12934_c0_g1_i1.p1  ORF type:complete len:130 (+),score=16.56 TRINITY_DN12934_c0_g1_i1:54-392(+)